MKHFFLILFVSCSFLANAQKVGLVLSGGAAKGLAHVGVLRALEDNDIPIDYIVGTSMGGIIGGCYAAGMSPDQIEAMMLSPEFLRWIRGEPERGHLTRGRKQVGREPRGRGDGLGATLGRAPEGDRLVAHHLRQAGRSGDRGHRDRQGATA